MEFNVPFQHKYGYIRDDTVTGNMYTVMRDVSTMSSLFKETVSLVATLYIYVHELSCVSDVVGFDVNVKDLYHGTTAPLDQICAEGLDPRISEHGHFGRGIYFRLV